MKTGWHSKSRKEKLEHVAWKGDGISLDQGSLAWMSLMRSLENLSHPEAPMPKFNDLLDAIVKANSHGKKEISLSRSFECGDRA